MGAVEKFFAGAFGLIALYLVVTNASGANTVLKGLGNFNATTFGTLQGRNVSSF
jgi:hypothetical protein